MLNEVHQPSFYSSDAIINRHSLPVSHPDVASYQSTSPQHLCWLRPTSHDQMATISQRGTYASSMRAPSTACSGSMLAAHANHLDQHAEQTRNNPQEENVDNQGHTLELEQLLNGSNASPNFERPMPGTPLATDQNHAPLVSKLGFLCNYYNFSLMSTAKPLIRTTFGNSTPLQESILTSASLAGAALGQILFGPIADRIGRKNASLISSSLATLGALGVTLAQPLGKDASSAYIALSTARFMLGVGAGGDLPILSSITTENSQPSSSAQALIHNVLMVLVGNVLAQAVYVPLIATVSNETAWRSAAGIGALLCASMVIARAALLKHDTRTHAPSAESTATTPEAAGLHPISSTLHESLRQVKELWKPLLGTALGWMLYDFVDFALGTSAADILGSSSHAEQGATLAAAASAITIAGPLLALRLIEPDQLGRKHLQQFGFVGLSICHGLLAASAAMNFWSDDITEHGTREVTTKDALGRGMFIGLYALQQLFDAAGAGVGIYVIPSEIFPSHIRSTCMGMASSAGKLGGFLGSTSMPFMRHSFGLETTFAITAIAAGLGAIATAGLIPEYGHEALARLQQAYDDNGAQGTMALLYPDDSRHENADYAREDSLHSEITYASQDTVPI